MIPLNMTTVKISRLKAPADGDEYDPTPEPYILIAEDVRATISAPSGGTQLVGGTRVTYNSNMVCDPVDLLPGDLVIDQKTGMQWRCLWSTTYGSFGVKHTQAQLRIVEGAT